MDTALDPHALGRLKWRCRRGLLENDLLIERFFRHCGDRLTPARARALERLMALPDPDLLDLLLARAQPAGDLDRPDVRDLLELMRVKAPEPARTQP
jgi:antitoxin CptB